MLYLPVTLRATLFLCYLTLVTGLHAQSLLDRLADDVCTCMSEAAEIVYPRIQASRCVDQAAERYGASIRKTLQLDVERAVDRYRLADLLIDPLTTNCPQLQDILDDQPEAELHYSDYNLLTTGQYYRSEKHPPADPVATTSKEGTATVEVTGTVERVGDEQFGLLTPLGNVLEIEYQSRQLREVDLTPGRRVTISYARDWDVAGTSIRNRLVEIK